MSLASNVASLAAAIRDKFNEVTPRLTVVGTVAPTPPPGVSVLWVDTTGGNVTLNLVTGE